MLNAFHDLADFSQFQNNQFRSQLDGLVVTATGPESAKQFAEGIIQTL